MSEGGIIVGLNGAHWAAAKPLVAELRGDGAPVRVCVDPRELLSIPAGSRVVLLEYVHDLAWLNLHRPVVRERKLRLFLWCLDQHINEMRVHAADFLDWVSHRVTIPPFLSQFAKRRLEEAQASSRWVAVRCASADVEALGAAAGAVQADLGYRALVSRLRATPSIFVEPRSEADVWMVLIAWMESGARNRVLLVNPPVVPGLVPVVDARVVPWPEALRGHESMTFVEAAELDLDPRALGCASDAAAPQRPPDAVQSALAAALQKERLPAARRLIDELPVLHEVALAWVPTLDPSTAGVWAQALRLRVRAVQRSERTRAERRRLLAEVEPDLDGLVLELEDAKGVAATCWEYSLAMYEAGGYDVAQRCLAQAETLLLAAAAPPSSVFHIRFLRSDCDRVQGRYAHARRGYRRAGSALDRETNLVSAVFALLREAEMLYLLDRATAALELANEVRGVAEKLWEPPVPSPFPDLALDAQEQLAKIIFGQLGDLYMRLGQTDDAVRGWLQGTGMTNVDEVQARDYALLDAYFQRHESLESTRRAETPHRFAAYADWYWRAGCLGSLRRHDDGARRLQLARAAASMMHSHERLMRRLADAPERVDWADLAAASASISAAWSGAPQRDVQERIAFDLWSDLDRRGVLPPVRRETFELLESRVARRTE